MGLLDDLMPAEGEAVIIIRSGGNIFHGKGLHHHEYSLDRVADGYCTCAPRRASETTMEATSLSWRRIPRPCYAEMSVSIVALPDAIRRQQVEAFERELLGIPLPTMSGDSVPAPERVTVGVPQPA